MGLATAIWDAVKDPLMKEVNKLKDEVEETILNLKEGVELLQSSKPEMQKEGLQQIKLELDEFMKSEVWALLLKTKSKTVSGFQSLLESFDKVLNEIIESFDDEDQRERLIALLRLKMQRITGHLSKLFNAKNAKYTAIAVRLLAVIVPAIAIYFLSEYVNKHNSFEHESTRLISPVDHLEPTKSGGYAVQEGVKEAYIREFEKAYFSYGWTEPKRKPTVFKIGMRNSSGQFPLMLSTLQLKVEYQEQTFDWHRLDTDAELAVKEDSAKLWLQSTKTAPLIDAYITSSIGFDTLIHVIRDSVQVNALGHTSKWWDLSADGSTIKNAPIYHKLSDDSYSTLPGVISNCKGTFRPINTVEQLLEITKGKVITEYEIKVDHEDVTGKTSSFYHSYNLANPRLFYENSDSIDIRDRLPSCMESIELEPDFPDGMIRTPDRMLNALGHKPVIDPNGVMLYRDSIKLDLAGIKDGDAKSMLRNVDVVMNPHGFVSLLVKFKNPNNGVYSVSLQANETQVQELHFEGFKAPESRFEYPESLKHFRKEEKAKVD